MKVLLVAINSKYIHSSLAVRLLARVGAGFGVKTAEYTINQREEAILAGIYREKPDVLCFSCYLWNIKIVRRIMPALKMLMPRTVIVAGGPEVSYGAFEILSENPALDIIIQGEGEGTFPKLLEALKDGRELSGVQGISYREGSLIRANPPRPALPLADIPFPYEDLREMKHKIIYYETQRGCPYSCQYCLSSGEKVRFLPKERVARELDFFLEERPPLVKFVDRTFNCQRGHALFIWRYLIKNDNGTTCFHMEIKGELLDEEALELLKTARPGLFQFEIGVQTANPDVLKTIRRETQREKLYGRIKELLSAGNIHIHLDLIAGLPGESFTSFRESFNQVYGLKPHNLQLGFLKLLKGSGLRLNAAEYGIAYNAEPPYEVLFTRDINFDELLELKSAERVLEIFYNSGKALKATAFAESLFETPFDFYLALGRFWERKGLSLAALSREGIYSKLYEFCAGNPLIKPRIREAREYLLYDMLSGGPGELPEWSGRQGADSFKERKYKFFGDDVKVGRHAPGLLRLAPKERARACRIEVFPFDVTDGCAGETAVLFCHRPRLAPQKIEL